MSTLRHRRTCAAFFSIALLDMAAMAQPCLEWATTEHSPGTRDEGAIAYDSARDLVVLFGGEREYLDPAISSIRIAYYNDTWEWDGSHWHLRQPATRPSPRYGHKMVYDSVRNVPVLVGGYPADASNSYRNETWEWNGVNWSLRGSTPGPDGSLVFDPIRGVSLYLVGNQAYRWNGANWSSLPPADNVGPSLGQYPWVWSRAAAFDSNRDAIVAVISTISSDIGEAFETWERNGNVWTKLQPASQPSPRRGFQLYFHPARGVTVLVGGYRGGWTSNAYFLDDTWEWDGTNWTLISEHGGLARQRSFLAYDESRNALVAYGGDSRFHEQVYFNPANTWTLLVNNDLWLYDGAWSIQYAAPPPRHGQEMVADTVRGKVVMFGGFENTAGSDRTLGDTWEWDGESWSQKSVSGPARRREHAMTFDAARHRTVLFGGMERQQFSEEVVGDTWEWDGAAWQLVSTTGPAPRFGHSMAYDENRGVTVLYGGILANNGWATDTWEWDGQSWEQKDVISSILGRAQASMAYDRSRDRVVLFGGGLSDPPTCFRDTWEWTGTDWAKIGDNGPVATMDAAMAYNSASESLVLFGGRNACNGNQLSNETWTWNGTQWIALAGAGAPAARHGHSMVYDPVTHEAVLFGGTDTIDAGSAMSGETKFLEPDFPLASPTYEASPGCNAATYVQKNRYLSFLPPSPADLSTQIALRVTLSQMPSASNCDRVPDFSAAEGTQMWIGPEIVTPAGGTGVHRLQTTVHFQDWAGIEGGVVHVADCNIVPCATYAIDAINNVDYPGGPYSAPLILNTSPVWGDIMGASVSAQLNGIVDFVDISASVDSFRRLPSAPARSRCDVSSANPTQGKNFPIDFGDISTVVDAFRGKSYPFAGPSAPLACP